MPLIVQWNRPKSGTRQMMRTCCSVGYFRLGDCLNLLDRKDFAEMEAVYARIMLSVPAERSLRNTNSGAHYLDRYIVDTYCRLASDEASNPFQTVRGCFPEGEPIYPGSKLLSKTHTQIAVRNLSCISRVSLVQFP